MRIKINGHSISEYTISLVFEAIQKGKLLFCMPQSIPGILACIDALEDLTDDEKEAATTLKRSVLQMALSAIATPADCDILAKFVRPDHPIHTQLGQIREERLRSPVIGWFI